MMEPGAGWVESKQLIGRIDRRGQKEAEVRIWMLVNNASAVDMYMFRPADTQRRAEEGETEPASSTMQGSSMEDAVTIDDEEADG
jgi:hypothetical protein